MSMTQAVKEAIGRVKTSTVYLSAVELRHSIFPAPLRFINLDDDAYLTLENDAPADPGSSVLFVGLGMDVAPAPAGSEPQDSHQLVMDGLALSLHPLLAAANSSDEPIQATFRPFIFDVATKTAIDEIISAYHLEVVSVDFQGSKIGLELGLASPINQKFPGHVYNADEYPSLYA